MRAATAELHVDFTAANGVPFRALLVGHEGNRDGATTVEFFDRRRSGGFFSEHGQFVSRYFVHDLLDVAEHDRAGLDLYGGEASWQIDGASMAAVRAWLSSVAEPMSLWDVLQAHPDATTVRAARIGGASIPFLSHATRLTGDEIRTMLRGA